MTTEHDDLARFIARCNPSAPATDDAYVERDPPLTNRLQAEIAPSSDSRVLLLGQTGVGKSTELIRLQNALDKEFCVLRPPLDTVLDLRDLTWHEILVFTAAWASEDEVITRGTPIGEAAHALRMAMRPAQMQHGPPQPTVMQFFRNSPHDVKRFIDLGRAQSWDLAEAVLRAFEDEHQCKIVLLVDGLEKMTEDAAKKLFYDEGRFLDQLPCRAVITAPLSLSFQYFFGDVEQRFPYPAERIRALSCLPGEPGVAFFRRLAEVRGAKAWMSEEVIDRAVSWGGGLPRQFLQLIASAASQALTDGTRVEDETFFRAAQRLIDRWQYQLEPSDYDELEKDDAERATATRARLLRLGALIEYDKPDGTLRLGVNPLVEVLLSRRRKQAERGQPIRCASSSTSSTDWI